ncbi:hypothetical protein AAE478_005216 [Parahypoxylon ruwenzoriense]
MMLYYPLRSLTEALAALGQQSSENLGADLPEHAEDTLNTEQRLLYDMYVSHYMSVLAGEDRPLLLTNCDGSAGSGKSYLMQVLSLHLGRLAAGEGRHIRVAPTGIASNAIGGSIIHSLLCLPVGPTSVFSELGGTSVADLQRTFEHVE